MSNTLKARAEAVANEVRTDLPLDAVEHIYSLLLAVQQEERNECAALAKRLEDEFVDSAPDHPGCPNISAAISARGTP